MSRIDDVLARAEEARAVWKSMRELIERARVKREEGASLIQIAGAEVAEHLDNLADMRPKRAAQRINALRSYILGPRPQYKVLTEQEWNRQVELARQIRDAKTAKECLEFCDQAITFAAELLDAHDTEDVLQDVEPIIMIAYDAHEQAIAWYEDVGLRISWQDFMQRRRDGLPDIAIEVARTKAVDQRALIEVDGKLVAPDADTVAAADRAAVDAGSAIGPSPTSDAQPAPEASNPTADPT